MIPSTCQITFVGMDAVDAARLEVRAWLPRLGALTDQVTGAHVVIEAFDEHRKQRLYRARMELMMPDGMVAVTYDHPSNIAHDDVYVAIRNAFRAARRQLEDYFKTRGISLQTRSVSEVAHIESSPGVSESATDVTSTVPDGEFGKEMADPPSAEPQVPSTMSTKYQAGMS